MANCDNPFSKFIAERNPVKDLQLASILSAFILCALKSVNALASRAVPMPLRRTSCLTAIWVKSPVEGSVTQKPTASLSRKAPLISIHPGRG